MNKPTNPERAQDKQDEAEIKNYTRSPNMLIFGYRELSPQEKWLYICLKHLCGKRGTRHLSLRYISEQTGISVGALSSSKDKKGNVNEGMIRHLHNTGLIHCEIKKHQGRGNALYHITITDVWALNQAFFIERKTRSDFGQGDGQEEDETSEPVRISDEPVQISDKPVRISDKGVQISDEPVRIPGQYQERYKTTDKTENKTTGREEGTSRDHDADTGSLHSPTPADPIAIDTPTHEEEHGQNHDGLDSNQHTRAQSADTRRPPARPEHPVDTPAESSGYEKDEEETVKTPVVRVPAQQLSTCTGSSAQDCGKVSAHVEPKVLDVRTLTLKAHTAYVFGWLDEIRKECERDPMAGYVQSKAAQGLVRDLIVATLNTPNELTREHVQMAWKEMFNTPTSRDGFSWKGNISIAAFCKHYGDYLGRARKPARPQSKPKSELVNRTYWTDADWDNYRRHGVLPGPQERIQA